MTTLLQGEQNATEIETVRRLLELVKCGRAFAKEARELERQFRDVSFMAELSSRPKIVPERDVGAVPESLIALAVTVEHLVGSVDSLVPPPSASQSRKVAA